MCRANGWALPYASGVLYALKAGLFNSLGFSTGDFNGNIIYLFIFMFIKDGSQLYL